MLWALHISDGVLATPWLAGGFVLLTGMLAASLVRVKDDEIARIGLLTAAFFVASLIHIRVGPTSVHLLLNGLVGVVLGRRAPLAITVGLLLQAVLLQHGGFTALGVNACVQAIPALVAWQLFGLLDRLPWSRLGWFRSALVGLTTLLLGWSLVFSVALLVTHPLGQATAVDPAPALLLTLHPVSIATLVALAALATWGERRLENAPEFALGLLTGGLAVQLTMALNCLVLIWGGEEDWRTLALVVFVAHLPVAVIEAVVLGFTVGFLARVKPEMLQGFEVRELPEPAEALS